MAQVKNMTKTLGMIMMLIVNYRMGWNMEEVARLVAAYRLIFLTSCSHTGNFVCSRATDGGEDLAMAGWKGEEDTVENQVSTFNTFILIVTKISGRFRQLRASTELCMGTRRTQWRTPPPLSSLTTRQASSLSATARFRRILFSEVLITCFAEVGLWRRPPVL